MLKILDKGKGWKVYGPLFGEETVVFDPGNNPVAPEANNAWAWMDLQDCIIYVKRSEA